MKFDSDSDPDSDSDFWLCRAEIIFIEIDKIALGCSTSIPVEKQYQT